MSYKKSGENRRFGLARCPYCGEKFWKNWPNKQYCCDQHGVLYRANRGNLEAAERAAKKPAESIADISKKARAAGLTYGQYMAARAVGRL